MRYVKFLIICLITIGFVGCEFPQSNEKFIKNPVDILVRDMNKVPSFSIILYDMDYIEDSNAYLHQYQIVKIEEGKPVPNKTNSLVQDTDSLLLDSMQAIPQPQANDSIIEELTTWLQVSDEFFMQHQDNMGMVIVSKKNGVVKKEASPPGYANFVGNEKYGRWVERDGGSFWEFYGKYMFISSIFRMSMYPVRYSYWNDYRNNYSGRAYYGPYSNGRRTYGTNGTYNSQNKTSKWNSKPNSFKQKVQKKVKRSVQNKKVRRNNSRYKKNNFKSRGRGYGK